MRALAVGLLLAATAARAAPEINEGALHFALHFLTEMPAEPVHHHHKHLVITPDSLKSGWAVNRQCH